MFDSFIHVLLAVGIILLAISCMKMQSQINELKKRINRE